MNRIDTEERYVLEGGFKLKITFQAENYDKLVNYYKAAIATREHTVKHFEAIGYEAPSNFKQKAIDDVAKLKKQLKMLENRMTWTLEELKARFAIVYHDDWNDTYVLTETNDNARVVSVND